MSATEENGTRRRTQAERRGEAEQRVLTAARDIVARKGWAGMTLAEVGEAAGYSRGLAAHHFGNKAGLLRALAGFVNEKFMERANAQVPRRRQGLDTIRRFAQIYFDRDEGARLNTRALLALLAEAVTEDSETVEVLAEYNRTVRGYIAYQVRTGIEAGEIRDDVHPEGIAGLFLGALRGAVLNCMLDPETFDPETQRRQLQGLFEVALAKR